MTTIILYEYCSFLFINEINDLFCYNITIQVEVRKDKMKKIMLVLLCLVSIVGCSSNKEKDQTTKENEQTKTTQQYKDLKIVDSGYTIEKNSIDYGVILENTNPNLVAQYPSFEILLYDKDDKLLTTHKQTLNVIAPQDKVAFGFVLETKDLSVDHAKFNIETKAENFVDKKENPTNKLFTIDKVKEAKGKNKTTFTAEITNNSNKDFTQVAVTLLLRKDGKIVYGTTAFVNNVNSKMPLPIDISTTANKLIDYDTYELSAQRW